MGGGDHLTVVVDSVVVHVGVAVTVPVYVLPGTLVVVYRVIVSTGARGTLHPAVWWIGNHHQNLVFERSPSLSSASHKLCKPLL